MASLLRTDQLLSGCFVQICGLHFTLPHAGTYMLHPPELDHSKVVSSRSWIKLIFSTKEKRLRLRKAAGSGPVTWEVKCEARLLVSNSSWECVGVGDIFLRWRSGQMTLTPVF